MCILFGCNICAFFSVSTSFHEENLKWDRWTTLQVKRHQNLVDGFCCRARTLVSCPGKCRVQVLFYHYSEFLFYQAICKCLVLAASKRIPSRCLAVRVEPQLYDSLVLLFFSYNLQIWLLRCSVWGVICWKRLNENKLRIISRAGPIKEAAFKRRFSVGFKHCQGLIK